MTHQYNAFPLNWFIKDYFLQKKEGDKMNSMCSAQSHSLRVMSIFV